MGGSTKRARKIAAPMTARFSITGVNAGMAKRRNTFSTPPAGTSDTNRMYGDDPDHLGRQFYLARCACKAMPPAGRRAMARRGPGDRQRDQRDRE